MKYVDLQVNGAFGVDFNDDGLTEQSFEWACSQLQESGVVGFLPTIITDSIDTMCSRIDRIASFLDGNPSLSSLVLGIHVEGPFISNKVGFFGTHPPKHIVRANELDTMRLLQAGRGRVRLVTLAPEQDEGGSVIRRLRSENVLVFAGHTDASISQLISAIDAGLMGFTHLGNGCVHQVDRQDNVMQRVLACREHLHITLIADGIHVPNWLLKSWIGIIGTERSIVISDSMSAAGMPPGEYSIGGQRILVEPSRRTRHRDHGYLAGSASTMRDMDKILSKDLSICEADRQKILFANALNLLKP